MTSNDAPRVGDDADDDLVPASFGAKLLLTAAPFAGAILVYLALRLLL